MEVGGFTPPRRNGRAIGLPPWDIFEQRKQILGKFYHFKPRKIPVVKTSHCQEAGHGQSLKRARLRYQHDGNAVADREGKIGGF